MLVAGLACLARSLIVKKPKGRRSSWIDLMLAACLICAGAWVCLPGPFRNIVTTADGGASSSAPVPAPRAAELNANSRAGVSSEASRLRLYEVIYGNAAPDKKQEAADALLFWDNPQRYCENAEHVLQADGPAACLTYLWLAEAYPEQASPRLLGLLGRCLLWERRYADAVRALERVELNDISSEQLYDMTCLLAYAKMNSGSAQGAKELLQNVVQRQPDVAPPQLFSSLLNAVSESYQPREP